VQAAAAAAAAGERDVERLFAEARFQLRLGELAAPLLQRRFEPVLGRVELLSERFSFFGRQRTELLEQCCQLSGLAEVLRLGVFERRGIAGGGELRDCTANYFF